MERKFRLVVNINFEWVLHELFANRPGLLRQCRAEHHDLLLSGSSAKDFLHVAPHICLACLVMKIQYSLRDACTNLVEHLVTLVEYESLNTAKAKLLIAHKSIEATWSRDYDVRVRILVGQEFNVLLNWDTTVEDGGLDVR